MAALKYIQVLLPLKLEWIPFYSIQEDIPVSRGDKVRVIFARKEYTGVVYSTDRPVPENLSKSKISKVVCLEEGFDRVEEKELKLWESVASYYMCTIGEVFKTAYPAEKKVREEITKRSRERRLRKIEKLRDQIERARFDRTKEKYQAELETEQAILEGGVPPLPEDEIELSEAQKEVFRLCRESSKPVLLQGVTGSGKTEIYCKLALETLAEGRNVLYLVPEIALSRQLEERLGKVFGERLLVFHSHLTSAARGGVAVKVAEGKGYVVLGTRSALFLPHRNLGLVVVDEEHDSSYKQSSPAPRYGGRDTAIMLAGIHRSKVVLGSATPSLESLYNALTGKFTRVLLKEKYHRGEEAEVEIIDTVAEARKRGMKGSFSFKLIERINAALREGGQIILLRNRRSYSPMLQCTDCGDIVKCPKCNIPMSYHLTGAKMICHHCGMRINYTGVCTSCGGTLAGLGSGSQKIEEEASELFPGARVARLDSDAASEEAGIIKDFSEHRIDILVGTQMVTKGFDFSGLVLVAVINADSLLAVEDFRADERAYDTLQQLRGRCSRRDRKGLLVVQTRQKTHPVFKKLSGEDTGENDDMTLLSERKEFAYPPFTRLIRFELSNRKEEVLERNAQTFCGLLESAGVKPVGPYSPAVSYQEGSHIKYVRVSLERTPALETTKKKILKAVRVFEKECTTTSVAIDVDPV